MRRLAALALLAASPVHADDEAPPEPTSVRAHLDGITAAITARYTFAIPGPGVQDVATIDLPSRALVIGATAIVDGARHPLALLEADRAEAELQHLRESGPASTRAWAVAITRSLNESVQLEVAAPHAATLTLELEISTPTCFVADVRYVSIPEPWRTHVDRSVKQVSDLNVCNEGSGPSWFAFPVPALAKRPPGDERIATLVGRLPLASQDFARVELDLSREISTVPRDLATVFVVDGSRSVEPAQVDAQRAVIASYLQHAPQTRVQVIAYARKAQALLPAWTSAADAAPRIDRELGALAPRNGSNLDLGLAEAGAWLSRIEGTRRIVLFTDELIASRLSETDPVALKRLLPPNTLVHVVAVESGDSPVVRDDAIGLASLATATDGLPARAGLADDGTADAEVLVRPISIDELKIDAPGWTAAPVTPSNGACPLDPGSSLAEGRSCTWWGSGDSGSGPITIVGLVWGHRFERTIDPDPHQALAAARELSMMDGLADEVAHEVLQAALAVNEVWSLFATWSKGGYGDLEETGSGRGGFGTCCGTLGTVGHGIGSSFGTPALDLKAQLANAIAACHANEQRIDLTIETTRDEIVDVAVELDSALSPRVARPLKACVEDATWDTFLALADAPDHATTHVAFGPGTR